MRGPVRVFSYCALGGVPLLIAGMGTGDFGWWWLAGAVLAAAFVPVAIFGPRTVAGQFGVIVPVLLIVTVFTTWSEALIFFPVPEIREHAVRNLVAPAVMYLIAAATMAVLARVLKLTRASGAPLEPRRGMRAVAMVLLSALAYVVYYQIFGWITFEFFTRPYYQDAVRTVMGLGLWFWVIQLGRGVIMAAAVLPVIYTLRMTRVQAAMAVAMLLWVAGGLVPLIPPNPLMSGTLRFIHMIEILTQNASLGATAVLLLRPGMKAAPQASAGSA